MVHSWDVVSPWWWCRSSCLPHRNARRCTVCGTTPVPFKAASTRRCRACPRRGRRPSVSRGLVSARSPSHTAAATTTSPPIVTGPQTHVVNVSFRQCCPTTTAPPAPAAATTQKPAVAVPVAVVAAPRPPAPVPAPAPKPVAPAPAPRHDRAGVVVRLGGGHLRQPDPGIRDGGDRDRRVDRGIGPTARSTTARRTTRAGSSTSPGHVLPARQPGGRGDRGSPQLVSPRHPGAAAPCMA